MDIELELVNRTKEEIEEYIQNVADSNMPIMVKGDIKDILRTIINQIRQTKKMGWLK